MVKLFEFQAIQIFANIINNNKIDMNKFMDTIINTKWDKSTKMLIISNLITIVLALVENWDLQTVLLIYWSQSVIIGYFNFKRILKLQTIPKKNSIYKKLPNNVSTLVYKKANNLRAYFFLFHYGSFQLVYYQFINSSLFFSRPFNISIDSGFTDPNQLPAKVGFGSIFVIFSIIVFYFNHRYSYKMNIENDLKSNVSVNKLMALPYTRIMPMHLTIIFGGFMLSGFSPNSFSTRFVLLFFLILKTVADVKMHNKEHNDLRKNSNLTKELDPVIIN